MKKDFLSITDLTKQEIENIIQKAIVLKHAKNTVAFPLQNKTLVMIFEKPSLRTRVSFEIGVKQLGGATVLLENNTIGLGTRESIKDISFVLARMSSAIMARVNNHTLLLQIAEHANVPVINGLSDLEHPCQILADLMTIYEKKGRLKNLKLACIGDGANNVAHSLCLAASVFDLSFSVASPLNYRLSRSIVSKAKDINKSFDLLETENVQKAVTNADVVITDTWVSMGNEGEKKIREFYLRPYQVTSDVMRFAKTNAIFLHCMPVYRGSEATGEVVDGVQSAMYQEAENRLHVQKALLLHLLGVTQP
ncbi:MAG TPA: ornithine carbamoyltransferase [Patescibacteria group bacterium]|nr:ornithine carbamoyltransferase [Patescibacteria group bacterium]